MKTLHFLNTSASVLVLSATFFLSSCADKSKEQVTPTYNHEDHRLETNTESTEMADIMRSKGMKIVKGEASELRGEYEVADPRLIAVSGEEDLLVTDGLPFQNYKFKFTRGQKGEMVIQYASLDGTDEGISVDSKMESVGDDFTISANMVSVVRGIKTRFHLIITGSKGSEKKGWEFAIIMKNKDGDGLNDRLIKKGSYRIFKGNGSEKEITPSTERRSFPENRIFAKNIFDIR
ncbi:MAG TPA: hypothetical protein PKY12_08535 [Catalimonadaceae bacterium]|nr:hypothetical protein [Catalimonadaceae bacterium]